MPIALLARPPQLLHTCGAQPPPSPSPSWCCKTQPDYHAPPPSPNQADDNPMGDIGKKISDFFSGLMPKEEEPPACARWSERWTAVAVAPGGAEREPEAPRVYGSIARP